MARERSREEGSARLLIVCPDQPGIVAAVSGWLFEQGANITDSAQHSTDPEGGTFFMRMESRPRSTSARHAPNSRGNLSTTWRVAVRGCNGGCLYATDRQRVAILASKTGSLRPRPALALAAAASSVPTSSLVLSNHADLEETVRSFAVPFEVVPTAAVPKCPVAEQRMLASRSPARSSLSCWRATCASSREEFLDTLGVPAINIHHSDSCPRSSAPIPYRRAPRARSQDHRRDRPLRHRGAFRRRTDHRAGRRTRLPSPLARRARADRPRHRAHRALLRAVAWHLSTTE